MILVAWDIETCPTCLNEFSEAQRARYKKELEWKLKRKPKMDETAASRLVRSVHPLLGWICCISAVSGTLEGGPNQPRSWSAASPDEEGDLLRRFWSDVAGFSGGIVWITFNGKRFDAPFLLTRTVRHRLTPSRRDLLNTYPYKHRPHADLSRLWPAHCTLDGLCDLLAVPTPKNGMDGSLVADTVANGGLSDVISYCERDVIATFECLRAMPCVLDL